MTRPKYSKEREQKVIDAEAGLLKRAAALDRRVYALTAQFISDNLISEGGLLTDSSSNYTKLSRLDKFLKAELKPDIDRLLKWYIGQILSISNLNEKYFGQMGVNKKVIKTAETKVLNSIGVSIDKKGDATIKPDGYVAQITDITKAVTIAKQRTRAAIGSTVIKLPTLRKNLQKKLVGDGVQGIMTRKLYEEAAESFIRTDLTMGRSIAKDVGIRAAIYTGGIIQSSRQFCRDRNAKVWTYEEIGAFADETWPEKPELYDPFTDPPGGYNCRHGWDHISDELAIILRPELADIWGVAA